MLVAVLIVGVLLMVAAPGFSNLISNNRMVSEVYVLRATLSHARSEALARRAPVVVCPTTDGLACADSNDWSTGYMTFVDTDDNNVANPADPDEELFSGRPGKALSRYALIMPVSECASVGRA